MPERDRSFLFLKIASKNEFSGTLLLESNLWYAFSKSALEGLVIFIFSDIFLFAFSKSAALLIRPSFINFFTSDCNSFMNKEYAQFLLNKTKEDYNLISEEFSRTRWFVWEETKFLFNDYIKEGEKILDIGCGNGRYFELLKIKNADYVGIDNSSKLIEEAKKKYPEADFRVADALSLPFGDDSFDKVYSIAVLHNIPSKELRAKFLSEAKRVLKKNGLLVITVWKFHQLNDYLRMIKYFLLKIVGGSKLDFKDFLEPWSDKALRYFHWFSKRELKKAILKSEMKIKETGVSKNKKGNRRNIYIIAQK